MAAIVAMLTPAVASARPRLHDGNEGYKVRPATILVSGDGTGWLGGDGYDTTTTLDYGRIRWVTFRRPVARGKGRIFISDCDPDCAGGTFSNWKATIRAWRVRHRHYTRLSARYRRDGMVITDRWKLQVNSPTYAYWLALKSKQEPAALAAPAAADATSPPARWCSESGDTCTLTEERGGVRYIEERWAERYADSLEICVRAPSGSEDCVTAPVGPLGQVYGARLKWAQVFPHRGPGLYLIVGPPEIYDVGFTVGRTRSLCRPIGAPEIPGYRYRILTKRVTCAAARRVIARASRIACPAGRCSRRVKRFRCRFRPVDPVRVERRIKCTRARRSISWIHTLD